MSTDQQGMELNVAMRVFCDAHRKQFERARLNEVYVSNSLVSAMFDKALGSLPEGHEVPDVVAKINEMSESGVPACCYVGEDRLNEIFADAPPSTGDQRTDFMEAAYAVPGIKPLTKEEEENMPEGAKRALKKAGKSDAAKDEMWKIRAKRNK